MKHLRFFIVLVVTVLAFFSSCKDKGNNDGILVSESNTAAEYLPETVMTELDSLAGLLIDEFEKYDLPQFRPGVNCNYDGRVVMWYTTKEESVEYSMGILFSGLGVDNAADIVRKGNEEFLAQKDSAFNHPLPCSFKEYISRKTPICELFGRYYEKCVETGEMEYFWKFMYAFFADADYLLCYKPADFLKGASEEQYQSYARKCRICREAVEVLSKENPQFTSLLEFRHKQAERYKVDDNKPFSSIQDAIKGYPAYYDYYQGIRHNLLTR